MQRESRKQKEISRFVCSNFINNGLLVISRTSVVPLVKPYLLIIHRAHRSDTLYISTAKTLRKITSIMNITMELYITIMDRSRWIFKHYRRQSEWLNRAHLSHPLIVCMNKNLNNSLYYSFTMQSLVCTWWKEKKVAWNHLFFNPC